AATRPAPVRSRISARSNSAMPANTVSTILPAGVVVSAQGSAIDFSPAPTAPISSHSSRRSRVERANGILVLEALAFRFHRSLDGLCCPSYDTLIAATGLCRQSIATALKRLEAAGILKITRRLIREVVGGGGFEMTVCRQGSNLYALFAPSEATDKLPCCAPMVRPFP